MQFLARRTAAVVAAAALALGAAAVPAQAATKRADLGTDWLAGELEKGLVHNDQYGFDDYGLTVDFGLALQAVGGHDKDLKAVRQALAKKVDSYTTGVDFGSSDVYSGATAKLTVFAKQSGADPKSYGGVNLVKRLKDLVASSGAIKGRIQDDAATDYANTIGQVFAAQALAGTDEGSWAKKYLLKQQCGKGYFRLSLGTPGEADQTCSGAPVANRAPDTDVTALAVIALSSIKKPGAAAREAVADAVLWLKRQQGGNGSFGGGTSTEAANTNSTGLAAWAFGVTGTCKRAAEASAWVKSLQVGPSAKGALKKLRGAIAYDRAALRAAKDDGITVETTDQWRRASAQAVPGLLFLGGSC